jgi:hypothetical protein
MKAERDIGENITEEVSDEDDEWALELEEELELESKFHSFQSACHV